ncbi:35595_t:CDS:2 [Racocetra persica]|uniref:35595_t:CDS:1 n=1 Tax=Racocetra persica TaxID=160502 RepID=A0ACA9KN85_9GLOM|nr:35595_t:CDS:2 [Racocetra persica]
MATLGPTGTPRPTSSPASPAQPKSQDETSRVGIICAVSLAAFIIFIISVITVRYILRQRRHDIRYGMSSAKIEASGLPENDNPTGHGDPRRKIRAERQKSNLIHGSGLGQPPIHPGPTYPGPTYPGPTYPGPTYPGPTYPGPTYPGPIYPSPRNNSQYNEQGEDNNILRIASDEGGRNDGSRNYGPSEDDILRVPSERESMNETMRLAQEALRTKSKEENPRESRQVLTFSGNTEIDTNLKDITQ